MKKVYIGVLALFLLFLSIDPLCAEETQQKEFFSNNAYFKHIAIFNLDLVFNNIEKNGFDEIDFILLENYLIEPFLLILMDVVDLAGMEGSTKDKLNLLMKMNQYFENISEYSMIDGIIATFAFLLAMLIVFTPLITIIYIIILIIVLPPEFWFSVLSGIFPFLS